MPDSAPHYVSRSAARLAVTVVRLAALYVLAGALAKLFWGSPADLPELLRNNAHGQLKLLFELVVGVELFAGVAALLAPRLAWPFLAGLLLLLLVVLGVQLSEGAASCGCFGSSIAIPPWAMIVVDGILVIAIFAVRPWHNLARYSWRARALAVAPLAAIAGSTYLDVVGEVPQEELEATDPFAGRTVPIPADAATLNLGLPGETTTPAARDADPLPRGKWRLPDHFPRYVILAPDRWIGKRLSATKLATWADTSKFPADGRVIFYHDTSDRFATRLRELADADLPESYVLIQLPTLTTNRNPRLVDRVPEGLHVDLPLGTRWMIRTPWDVTLKDGRVSAATFLGE